MLNNSACLRKNIELGIDLEIDKINSLCDLLKQKVEKIPHDIANYYWQIVEDKQNHQLKFDTWLQIQNCIKYLSYYLANIITHNKQNGVNKIGIFLPTSYALVITNYACLYLAYERLAYHHAWQSNELKYVINMHVPNIIVTCEYLYPSLKQTLEALNLHNDIKILIVPTSESHFFEHINKLELKNTNYYADLSNNLLYYLDIWKDDIYDNYIKINNNNHYKSLSVAFTSGSISYAKAEGVVLKQQSMLIVAIEAYQTLNFNASKTNFFHWIPFSHLFGRIAIYISILINAKNYFSRGINYFSLHIKGKTKEIIMMQNGENIHPAKLEHLLNKYEIIEESCIVDDNQTCLIALIVIKNIHQDKKNIGIPIKAFISKINLQLPRFERISNYNILPYLTNF